MRETLDEAIDRVASTLTMVSASSRVVEQLDEQLGRRRLPTSAWLVLATASVMVLAAVLIDQRDHRGRQAVVQLQVPTLPTVAGSPLSPSIASAIPNGVVDGAASTVARRVPAVTDPQPAPMIAALPSPPALVVDGLQLDSLAIAPVEIAHLDDLPSLEVPALETTRLVEFR